MRIGTGLVLGIGLAFAAPPPSAKDCTPCHAQRVENQSKSPHALALRPWTGAHFAGRKIRERSGTEYVYTAQGVEMSRGDERLGAAITWAFGSGIQAITPVIEKDGKLIEHRVSWYAKGDRLSLSPGHDPSPRIDLTDSLGIVQTEVNATRCVNCHTTGGAAGVFCQNCHGDGATHRAKPGRANIQRDRSVQLCAKCHRSPDSTFASKTPELDDPLSVRFAPVGLMASRCFRVSKTLTCVSCHDPHGEARRMTVDQVCSSCHRPVSGKCPRTENCASCHMPAVSPVANLKFTDHRIR